MFLSEAAIIKQLFHEFLTFETLAIDPGKPVELRPGTLFGSSSKKYLGLALEFVEKQLKAAFGKQGTPEKQKQFNDLLTDLMAYKKASQTTTKTFSTGSATAYPNAWLVFAPLVIEPAGSSLSYETEQSFKDYLKKPRVAFSFDTQGVIEKTGLYIAVQTQNPEMVDAFLTPDFYSYSLTMGDLKKLLDLTEDPQTRLALYRHSKDLINWIIADDGLKLSCVKSFEELSGLWSYLNEEQRKQFIQHTNSQLWLNLLDKGLGKQKIEKLLGPDFVLLNKKLLDDITIRNHDALPETLRYLDKKQQFKYLLELDLNNLYQTTPRGESWQKLLSSLGYKHTSAGLTTTRYVFPEEVAYVHNQLISVLVSLPVEAKVIIEALEKIEAYVNDPKTTAKYDEYKASMSGIAKDAVYKEYESNNFVVNWFNWLLRALNIISASPLHPYLDKLVGVIEVTKQQPISGELMSILPPTEDYEIYKEAISAYFQKGIGVFWSKLSPKVRKTIVEDPIRFEALVRFLSAPVDKRSEFVTALDADSLTHFNKPNGLRQLFLETPSFDAARDLTTLVNAMKAANIVFLEEVSNIRELLVDSNDKVILKEVAKFLPLNSNNEDGLNFQESVFNALPKPLKEEHFNRFLQAYCSDANHFSSLLGKISITNSETADTCWKYVPSLTWDKWYADSQHAVLWSNTLKIIPISERLAFFEKLTSDGKLTAVEFCDFLLVKDQAVFNTLWNNVPKQQWATWIKDNNLPESTVSLLNTLGYPLIIPFFKFMLNNPGAWSSICVDPGKPGKTIEQFYLQDVNDKMKGATGPNDIIAKLAEIKKTRRKEFDDGLQDLTKAIEGLNKNLEDIGKEDIKGFKGNTSYALGMFKTYPYYTYLSSIKTNRLVIEKLFKQISSHPLFTVVKDAPEITKLGVVMKEIRKRLEDFSKKSADVPTDLRTELDGIELISKKIDAMSGLAPVVVSKVTPDEPGAPSALLPK